MSGLGFSDTRVDFLSFVLGRCGGFGLGLLLVSSWFPLGLVWFGLVWFGLVWFGLVGLVGWVRGWVG